jgi:hypothetical protein
MSSHESNAASPEMAPNQHDPAVNAESTRLALIAALDYWEKAACGCCAPTVLDDAIDRIGYEAEFWARMRHFAIELAQVAQNVIDEES